MSWGSIRGHDAVVDRFRRAIGRGRLASTFLFVGPSGIGKRAFALRLAQAMLCERVPEEQLAPCGECPSCHQVVSQNHPDIERVSKPADKAFIPIELLIGDADHRMRAGLCYNIALKPYSGRRKIAIIDDADYLNKEGANCLLKTLEEPPPRSLLILLGTSEQRQLPTIRSRCQIVRFQPLAEADVKTLLLQQQLCEGESAAQLAASRSSGSLERAALWCDSSLVEFRRDLMKVLSQPLLEIQTTAKLISQFVDEAGKDSAAKRQRLRLIVSLAEELYDSALVADLQTSDGDLAKALAAFKSWMSEDGPAACLEVCLEAYAAIDANVNQATLVEWWLDELHQATRGAVPTER